MARTHCTLINSGIAALALLLGLDGRAEPTAVQNANFEPAFERVLRADPTLLRDGGAKVIESDGARFFIAVGFTTVLDGSPTERVRQLRVARIQALRQAAEFANPTRVTSETRLTETTTVTQRDGVKNTVSGKSLNETTVAEIRAILQAPSQVGSWKSADGQLFFYAIGTKLK